jgi:hypothetical protein
MWICASWFHRLKSHENFIRDRDITRRDIPKVKRIVWGHGGVGEADRWRTISRFRGKKSRNNCIRICDITKSEKPTGEKIIEKSNSRAYQSFVISGFRSRRDELFDITSVEIAIEKILKEKKRVSVDCCRVLGIHETNARPLESQSSEVRSPEWK